MHMDVSDSSVGKLVLVLTASVFLIIVIWVNTYPFIDKGQCSFILLYNQLHKKQKVLNSYKAFIFERSI